MNLLLNAGQAAGALIAIFSLFGLIVKYLVLRPIKAYIDHATYPIQPHANGGGSLPDLVNTVNDLKIMLVGHIKDHDTP